MTENAPLWLYRSLASLAYLGAAGLCAAAGLVVLAYRFGDIRGLLRWRHAGMLAACAALQVAGTALASAFHLLGRLSKESLVLIAWNWIVVVLAALALPLGLWATSRRPDPPFGRRAWLATAAGTLAILVWSFGLILLLGIWIDVRENPAIEELVKSPWAFGAFVPIALLAPIAEEIIFRLAMQGGLERLLERERLPAWLAVLPVSLVFALGHAGMALPDGVKEVQIFGVGLLLGWLKIRHGFGACVAGHMGLNLAGVLLQVWAFLHPGTFDWAL